MGMEAELHAVDWDEWSAPCSGRFNPEYEPLVLIRQEDGWAPEPVWMRWQREEHPITVPAGTEPRSSSQ